MLLTGEILLGIPWGAFQTLTVTYAAEVCPLTLRVYLTTYVNVCWVIGQLISSCILRGLVNSTNKNAYQIPFGIQWVWPIPLAIGIYLAPESPWWSVKSGKNDLAKRSIKRLLSAHTGLPDTTVLANAMFDKMQLVVKEEEALNAGVSYMDCLRKGSIRRTRIAAITWLAQSLTGSSLMGYSTYFYTQAGLDTSMSFTFSIIQYVLGLIGTIGSWFLSQKLGRFSIFFGGLCTQTILMLTVGILGCYESDATSWAVGSMLLFFAFVYDLTVGPITYCMVSEVPSVRLRTKTVIISRNVYNLAGIITSIICPYMLNPTAWNWKAKTGFFWFGFCVAATIWAFFELPETKGKTFAELDKLFEDGVPARKFKSTQVETFNTQVMIDKVGKEGIKNIIMANKAVNDSPADIPEKV
ncbi:unnamed protein product [Ambrosiozyma monospora]|uniref:Unnamed protein product n=1 Tax=Ambrosiozyma monospora TaxID=43982 RepID=A0ACB5SWB4_AMBMO|nr:unnamed protein product [Ambrosiozyma monospora]